MDNREIRVSASGKAIDYLTDYRKEKILDVAIEGMKKGNYADTARSFIFSTAKYMAQGIPENQHRQGVKNNTLSSEIGEHTSELQSRHNLVCRLLLEKKK